MRSLTKYFFFIICIINALASFSQNIDSLKIAISTAKTDSVKVKLLNQIAWKLKGTNPDTSIILCNQALDLAKKIDWTKGLAQTYNQLGAFYTIKSDYAISLSYYNKSLEFWTELIASNDKSLSRIGKITKAKTIGNIGIVYQLQANYSKALEYFFNALQMSEELKDKKGISQHLVNIGLTYYYQSDFSQALDYLFKALKLEEELGDQSGIATSYGNIGLVYAAKKDYAQALDYYYKALKNKEGLDDKSGIAYTLLSIAYVYHEQGDSKRGLDEALKALIMFENLGEKNLIAYTNMDIGNNYLSVGNFSEAENYLKAALKLATEIGGLEIISATEESLSKLYERNNKHELAFEYYKKFILVRDSISNEENQKKQVRSEMNYEFDKKEAILKEQQEKERAIATEKNRFQQIVIATVVLGLLLVIVFLIFVFQTLKTTKKQKITIEIKQQEILDSIHYAKRIQTALMTNENYIDKNLNKLQEK